MGDGRVSVRQSAVRPDRFRLRVAGPDGGELAVTRADLQELVELGTEALEHEENGPGPRKCAP